MSNNPDIEEDLQIDKKVEDILRESEENLIRMHLERTGKILNNANEEELRDTRILMNFQNVIHALSTLITHEQVSIKSNHYDKSQEDDVLRYLVKMKSDIDAYERNIAQLRSLIKTESDIHSNPQVASQMRTIMMKRYNDLHDLYKDIIALDAKIMVKIHVLIHRN